MSAYITSHNNYKEHKLLSEFRLFDTTEYRENIYEIDGLYSISITHKKLNTFNIAKVLRNDAPNKRRFINFYFKNTTWQQVYSHFITHFEEFNGLGGNYLNEMFRADTPTRMFFDLDIKEGTQQGVDTYISNLVSKVSKFVCKDLEYIVTKNNNNDLKRHVIITNLILPNIEQCKVLASKFQDDYVDLQPYRTTGSLRVLGGMKPDNSGKVKVFDRATCIINSDETYLIQPYEFNAQNIANYNIPNYKKLNNYQTDPSILSDESLAGLDLDKYGLVITNRIGETNLYSLHRPDSNAECPLCSRCHGKSDTLYLVVHKSSVYLRCYRSENKLKIKSNKMKFSEFLDKITALNYNFLKSDNNLSLYNNINAQMPEKINSDVLYLVSPCKSSKTKTIHEYLSKEENMNKSVCFITMQTKFTRNLHERFSDLGFSCYLNKDFKPDHSKIIISLYSLHRVNTSEFDIIIIDEVESMLINFCSVGVLGQKDVRRKNLDNYKRLIHNSGLIILMDAYPSQYCLEHFKAFDKKIHVYMNEYKTHKDDKIILMDNFDLFINEMAQSLSKGQNIIFASALKDKQKEILNKVYNVLSELYNYDVDKITSLVYNSELDKSKMDESIQNIDSDWYVNLLAYSPCITAGISFEGTHFDKVFYLGFPNANHISTLQSLYRARNISTREYYITFGRSYTIQSQLYSEEELNKLSQFNKLENTDMLDYDQIHSDFGSEVRKANTLSNRLLEISDEYLVDSQKNYYKYVIGQFKYNGSSVEFRSGGYKQGNSFDVIDSDDVNEFFKSAELFNYNSMISKLTNSEVVLEDKHYNELLPNNEYEELHNKVNKTLQEEAILEVNTYARMFPKFNKQAHEIVAQKPAAFHRYYNSYKKYSKYVNEEFNVYIGFKKNKADPIGINDEPLNRFRTQIVSKFLQRLLVDDTLTYQELHDAEYRNIRVDELIDAMQYIQNEVLQNDKKYIEVFMREFYSKQMYKDKVPMNKLNSYRHFKPVLTNMLDGTFNFECQRKVIGKNKEVAVSFIHPTQLF